MNHTDLWLMLGLLVPIAGLSVAATRLHTPPPLLMLSAGIVASFIPGLPSVTLKPDAVLLLLLPPLLYSSGVGMSWRGFRANLRPILMLAIGCVLFTAAAVASVVHYAFGVPWAIAFMLGAIVSPPDAVAPMAIARRLHLPRRISTILEGESLVNDATALVIFSFALAAVITGHFSIQDAALKFVVIVAGEIAYGLFIGWGVLWLRYAAKDPRAEVLLAMATPFVAFWPAHELGGSGVVAAVVAGLWVSWNGRELIRPATRLQGFFIWNLFNWVIEALLFLLTGLQARSVIAALSSDGLNQAILTAAVVSVTVIVVRFIWVFPATYLPRLLMPFVCRRDPAPNWRLSFMIGFTGLRGAVSIAAALAIPVTLGDQPFPYRDLVLFTTFVVILVTLYGEGALLPVVIRALGLARTGRAEAIDDRREEQSARIAGIDAALAALEKAETDGAPMDAVASLRRHHSERRKHAATSADQSNSLDPVLDSGRLQLELVSAERRAISIAYVENRVSDEARRRIERELDLEEARIHHLIENPVPDGDGVAT